MPQREGPVDTGRHQPRDGRAEGFARDRANGELERARDALAIAGAQEPGGSLASALIASYGNALDAESKRRAVPDDRPFAGRSVMDLEAERAQLEHAIDQLDASEPFVARMQARLNTIREEVRNLGLTGR